MMRRFIIICLMALFTATTWAYDFESGRIYYNILSDTEMTVEVTYGTLYGTPAYSGTVNIPEEVEYEGQTYTVVGIGDSAFDSCSLETIYIPETLQSIGREAFYYCDELLFVYLPEGLTFIGAYAFSYSHIVSAEIPSTVSTIEEGAFAFCLLLREFDVDRNNEYYCNDAYGVLYNKDMTTLVQCPSAFEEFDTWKIPSSVTTIGPAAFYYCMELEEITIPDNVKIIDTAAFYYSPELYKVTMSNNIERIEYQAFAFCYELTEMNLPNSLTYIGDYAFEYCEQMQSIILSNSVDTIGQYAFENCESLKNIVIPSSVKSIGEFAFADCYLNELDLYCRLETYIDVFNMMDCKTIYAHADQVDAVFDEWGLTVLPFGAISAIGAYPRSIALEVESEDGADRREVQSLTVEGVEVTPNEKGLYILTGLTPNSYYYCTLSFTFDGNSLTDEVMVTTLDLWEDVVTLDVTSSTASFQITINEDEYNGNPDEYGLRLGETYYAADSDGIITVTDLEENTEYIFRLYANYGEEIITGATIIITTAVDGITNICSESSDVEGYYTIGGQQINALQVGVNIVRYSDGTTKKVLVK